MYAGHVLLEFILAFELLTAVGALKFPEKEIFFGFQNVSIQIEFALIFFTFDRNGLINAFLIYRKRQNSSSKTGTRACDPNDGLVRVYV